MNIAKEGISSIADIVAAIPKSASPVTTPYAWTGDVTKSPPRSFGLAKSDIALMKTSRKADITPGAARGRVMVLNNLIPLAPRFCAAISMLGEIARQLLVCGSAPVTTAGPPRLPEWTSISGRVGCAQLSTDSVACSPPEGRGKPLAKRVPSMSRIGSAICRFVDWVAKTLL